jgi:general secretion pathway protein D
LILRVLRTTAFVLLIGTLAGCGATSSAVKKGDTAAEHNDWDAAVTYYREALGREPNRVDVKISLQRAMTAAAAVHIKRARDYEAQDQLAGAIAEYRLAVELDSSNTLAFAKANELEKRQRDRVEATRQPSQLEQLRAQVRQSSTIPTLDPRVKVNGLRFANASVRDILNAVAAFTNPPINITFARSADPALGQPYSFEAQDLSLEEALNQVLSNNNLAFKIVNSRTVLVFADTAQEHTKYDDLYSQVFFLSHVEPQDMIQIIQQMTNTTGTGAQNRPTCMPSKNTRSITCRATGPLIGLVEKLISANDKPKAEVLIDVEVLEVDRKRVKQLGLDLSQYALGVTFSPEVAPPNTAGTFPPATPPPFNANTISRGVAMNDFYLTVPTAVIRLLESDNKTKTLAKPSVRGAEGAQITMNLGDQIPVLNSTIPSFTSATGTTAPVTNFTYKPIGVNLQITPTVTFNDEIILDLIVDNSGVGATLNVGGTNVQSFTGRTVHTMLRLRDGESNLLAGLLREQNATINTGFAGMVHIPLLKNIFGNTDETVDTSDVVIVVTPHIVRSHELTTEDLKPMYIGTQQNLGQTNPPALISAETPLPAGVTPAAPGVAAGGAGVNAPIAPNAPAVEPPRAVPIEPAGGVNPPAAPAQTPLITLYAPGMEFQSGSSTPYTVPIAAANLPQVSTMTLHVNYNPTVLRAQAAVQGTFMNQGNITPTFVPRINANDGVVDIVLSRPNTATGASGSGLLGSVQFLAMSPGSAQVTVSGSVIGAGGQPIQVQFGSVTVVVR